MRFSSILKSTMLVIGIALLLSACTDNKRARSFGGTMTVELPKCQRFDNASWKGESLMYTYRQAEVGETSRTYTMRENSSFGLVEGTVIFKETIDQSCFPR